MQTNVCIYVSNTFWLILTILCPQRVLGVLQWLKCTVLYCTVLYCTVLYCTVLYCLVECELSTYGIGFAIVEGRAEQVGQTRAVMEPIVVDPGVFPRVYVHQAPTHQTEGIMAPQGRVSYHGWARVSVNLNPSSISKWWAVVPAVCVVDPDRSATHSSCCVSNLSLVLLKGAI